MSLSSVVSGDGPDLVLIHGWGAGARTMGGLAAALATRFRVHALELPGYGASPSCEPCGLRELVRAVATSAPPVCHVVGWSLGALVALAWASSVPRQVGRIALLAASPCFVRRDDWPHGVESRMLTTFARDLQVEYQGTIRRFIALQALGDVDARRIARKLQRDVLQGAPPDAAALADGLRILRDADLRSTLSGIAHETLVVHGDRDRLTPPAAGLMLGRTIPGARVELVRGAAHAPFLSSLPRVSQVLSEFLDG